MIADRIWKPPLIWSQRCTEALNLNKLTNTFECPFTSQQFIDYIVQIRSVKNKLEFTI